MTKDNTFNMEVYTREDVINTLNEMRNDYPDKQYFDYLAKNIEEAYDYILSRLTESEKARFCNERILYERMVS